MRNIKILILATISLLVNQLQAQDGYGFSLLNNGSFNFTIEAIPNDSALDFTPMLQSYGFVIILPDGITMSLRSSLGHTGTAKFFDGELVGMPDIDGYLVTETLAAQILLPKLSRAQTTPVVTIKIHGEPTQGSISILKNDSPLANSMLALKSFMQADIVDNETVKFTNVIDPIGSGVIGNSKYDFSTKPILEENDETQLVLYPNPASKFVTLQVPKYLGDYTLEIFDNLGKQIEVVMSEDHSIDVRDLSSGLYIVSIISGDTTISKKLIVK